MPEDNEGHLGQRWESKYRTKKASTVNSEGFSYRQTELAAFAFAARLSSRALNAVQARRSLKKGKPREKEKDISNAHSYYPWRRCELVEEKGGVVIGKGIELWRSIKKLLVTVSVPRPPLRLGFRFSELTMTPSLPVSPVRPISPRKPIGPYKKKKRAKNNIDVKVNENVPRCAPKKFASSTSDPYR